MGKNEGDRFQEQKNASQPVRLLWPGNETLVHQTLELVRDERRTSIPILFRSSFHELRTGDIVIEPDTGLPHLTVKQLPSYAYKQGSWEGVLQSFEQSEEDLNNLVRNSDNQTDARKVLSPFIWTTEDPTYAFAFGPTSPEGQPPLDQVLLILRPDPKRVRILLDPNQPFSSEHSEQFGRAIRERKPYFIDIPSFAIPDGEGLAETLWGPYIQPSEIKALVTVRADQRAEFLTLIADIFPEVS